MGLKGKNFVQGQSFYKKGQSFYIVNDGQDSIGRPTGPPCSPPWRAAHRETEQNQGTRNGAGDEMRNAKKGKDQGNPPPTNFMFSGGPSVRDGASMQGRPGPLVTVHARTWPGGQVEARPLYHCRKACPWYQGDGWNLCAKRNRENPAYCDSREAQAEALAGLAKELEGMARDMRAGIIADRKRAEREQAAKAKGGDATGAD